MGDVIRLDVPARLARMGEAHGEDAASVAWERYCVLVRPIVDDPALLFDRARVAAALRAERAFRAAFLRVEVATVLHRE
jgi:hypothetical protein